MSLTLVGVWIDTVHFLYRKIGMAQQESLNTTFVLFGRECASAVNDPAAVI